MAMKKTTAKKTTRTSAADSNAPDHDGGSATTTDHETIKAWAEARGGRPASVEGTERGDEDVGLIRLEFPKSVEADDDKLEEVDWEPFFEKFDASGLAMVYQENTADGQMSMFNRFVKRETAAAKNTTVKKTTAAKKTSTQKPVAKQTAAKKTAAKKVAPAPKATVKKTAAKKAPPAAAKKATATKKTAAKTAAKKAPAAKKTAAKKVPPARGYRGR